MPGEPACFNLPIPAEAYIALGSNLGDRATNLRGALERIRGIAELVGISRVYETEPVGFREQPDFWNLVVRIHTTLEPEALFHQLKRIEADLGRSADFRNAPRIIDLDLLTYDAVLLKTPNLEIPHPRMHQRTFVLYPLAELEPSFRHPATGMTIDDLIAQLPDPSRVVALDDVLLEEPA
jgi:2-amino-4-hydroxy-6-hydroxymethyldihydropteridine diphosphokinase